MMSTHKIIRAGFRYCASVMAVYGVLLSTGQVVAQPTNSLSSYDRGVASIGSNDWANAVSSFSEAIKHNPKDALAYEYRGFAYIAEGQLDHAISDFTQAIKLDPDNAKALCNRGIAYRAKGEFKSAIRDLSKAIRLCPTNDAAYMQRASVYNVTGDYDRAIADWNAGLSLNPGEAMGLAMRGFAYSQKREYEKAVRDYREAIRLDPANHAAYNDLSWLRATCPKEELRNGKEAVTDATKACELTGWTNWTRVDTLAAALAEAGEFQKAVDYQKQALRMNAATKAERADMQRRLALYARQQPAREEAKQ